jgi:hypothetical protein
MRTVRLIFVLPVILMTASGSAFAADRQHVVNPSQLAATVADRVAAQDADRAAVREALARSEVREVAASMGVDPNRLTAVAETLGGVDLAQAASAARQINDQLVGGASTIVISTTTIIVVLLVVILLIVALK